ncbi:unnamed protein product [Moneuplotes crassus]|uniref:Uncharacterized protein n=1 Tax=Euplotes crassus TaxID=5936 RepID=A0AAD1U631_EUPCR|nr:unnamed protein product [Moneuplotes crassus]
MLKCSLRGCERKIGVNILSRIERKECRCNRVCCQVEQKTMEGVFDKDNICKIFLSEEIFLVNSRISISHQKNSPVPT